MASDGDDITDSNKAKKMSFTRSISTSSNFISPPGDSYIGIDMKGTEEVPIKLIDIDACVDLTSETVDEVILNENSNGSDKTTDSSRYFCCYIIIMDFVYDHY
jgi:hypothetical protein